MDTLYQVNVLYVLASRSMQTVVSHCLMGTHLIVLDQPICIPVCFHQQSIQQSCIYVRMSSETKLIKRKYRIVCIVGATYVCMASGFIIIGSLLLTNMHWDIIIMRDSIIIHMLTLISTYFFEFQNVWIFWQQWLWLLVSTNQFVIHIIQNLTLHYL